LSNTAGRQIPRLTGQKRVRRGNKGEAATGDQRMWIRHFSIFHPDEIGEEGMLRTVRGSTRKERAIVIREPELEDRLVDDGKICPKKENSHPPP